MARNKSEKEFGCPAAIRYTVVGQGSKVYGFRTEKFYLTFTEYSTGQIDLQVIRQDLDDQSPIDATVNGLRAALPPETIF